MPVEQQLSSIFEVIEGGAEVSGEIIPFPSDAGVTALEGVTETVELGNGVATEVSQLTVVEGGATATAGVGLLGVEVGAGVSAIAIGLGVLAGVGLYELAPEFWTNVSNSLVEAGQTVGGKIRAFLNSDNRTIGYSEETIEIVKNALIDAGIFEGDMTVQELPSVSPIPSALTFETPVPINNGEAIIGNEQMNTDWHDVNANGYIFNGGNGTIPYIYYFDDNAPRILFFSKNPFSVTRYNRSGSWTSNAGNYTYNNVTIYYYANSGAGGWYSGNSEVYTPNNSALRWLNSEPYKFAWALANSAINNTAPVQPDATLPSSGATIPQTYPTWTPYTLPDGTTKVYPVELPVINPDGTQETAQDPEPLPENSPALLEWLLNNFPQPEPNPNPYPEPVVNPDPDPQPEPDPITPPEDPTTDPNPANPNPEPTDPFPAIVPTMPDTVPANAMFTVYKPTIAQLNSFGGWLWSNNILEMIKKIWQNPLDGIIAFMKVYADPTTSGTDTIKVGILDSEVTSAVVSGQFVTVECGSVNINEKFYNATDYSPFVGLHLYLPFIGIVELDIDEFMKGEIKITYHIDIYTGTCLAEVKAKRTPDMTDYTIVYTFSGNASQQLPLTSAEFSGALTSLVGVVGGGLAIASGGGLGIVAGATGIAHSVTHEMVHLAHSGSLSANAGIMGSRTPFLILTRRRSYDANGYNQLYGYPTNKTVFLNNCNGFVKVKDIQLQTGATDEENNEIKALLSGGVII